MTKTVILGVGNLLLTDDGVGIHAIQKLQADYSLPAGVQVVDGGTCGLDLLQFLEGVDHLIIIDAARLGKTPGSIVRLEGDQVPAYLALKTSPHEIGLPELLFTARLTDIYPNHVVVFGVQPESIETHLGLTPAVAGCLDELVEMAAREAGAVRV
ncbi:hydrogenase maturation protease [bacterium]|nr:hydrogenase maturation protease [bacterium]